MFAPEYGFYLVGIAGKWTACKSFVLVVFVVSYSNDVHLVQTWYPRKSVLTSSTRNTKCSIAALIFFFIHVESSFVLNWLTIQVYGAWVQMCLICYLLCYSHSPLVIKKRMPTVVSFISCYSGFQAFICSILSFFFFFVCVCVWFNAFG